LVLAGAVLLATRSGRAASAEGQPAAPAPSATVDARLCQQCHWDKFQSYLESAHGRSGDAPSPAAQAQCESCHGTAERHVQGGGGRGVGALLTFAKQTPVAQRNAPCLTCHERGQVALWHGSAHDSRKVACTDCHAVHGGHAKLLAQPTEPQLCTQCHLPVRGALLKSSHHPIREGKLACTSCHNPHGTATEKLVSAASVNDKCYECHAETRGPFLFEHPPVRESCLNCHDPHGSSHEYLLVAKRPLLCQRCHQNAGHSSALLARTAPDAAAGLTVYQLRAPALVYRACNNCHVQIHGSNHPSGKFWHR
jgi:DmsE family decaheme c-type cytochrome